MRQLLALALLTVLLLPVATLAAVGAEPFTSGTVARPASEEEQRAWSEADELHDIIVRSGVVYDDPALTAYVQRVMDRLYPEFRSTIRLTLLKAPHLNAFAVPDGGIYVPGEGMNNYHASVALMALASMNDPKLAETARNMQKYLKELQWDSGEGHEASSAWYGGAGYGKSKRPDLSNTQLMLEALHESGLKAEDPAFQKAMAFISRIQSGVAVVNGGTYGSEPHMPFGGLRESGNGWREAGTQALDVYSDLKTVYINHNPDRV